MGRKTLSSEWKTEDYPGRLKGIDREFPKYMNPTTSDDPDFKLTSVLTFKNPSSADIAAYDCECVNTFQEKTYTDKTTVELRVG